MKYCKETHSHQNVPINDKENILNVQVSGSHRRQTFDQI